MALNNLIQLPRDTRVVYPESDGEPTALLMTSWWYDALQAIIEAVASGGGGGSGVYEATLTPADNVVPTLELADENATFFLLLDRALTTIETATLNGGVPPDGWRFTLFMTNDSTDGRDVTFDPAYRGWVGPSGVPDAADIYEFTTKGGEFFCRSQEHGI